MADVKISQLTAATGGAGGQMFEISDSGTSKSITLDTLVAYHTDRTNPHSQYALASSLGDAATKHVGTSAGTVAAGDHTHENLGSGGGTEYSASTTDATATALANISVASGSTVAFEALVVARRTDVAGEGGMWKLEGLIQNNGGVTALIGDVLKTVYAKNAANLYCNATADDTNDRISITVNGEYSKSIAWKALVRTISVN